MRRLPSNASMHLATIRFPRLQPPAPGFSLSRTSLQIVRLRPEHLAQFVVSSPSLLLSLAPAGFQRLPPSVGGALALLPVRVGALPVASCARRFARHRPLADSPSQGALRSVDGGDSTPRDILRYSQ